MKFIANTFFIAILWRRYKRLIVAVALLFASYYLISALHEDYLDYVKNSGNDGQLGLSYLVKWLALLLATIAFYFLILTQKNEDKTENKLENLEAKSKKQSSRTEPDPFAAIRHKEKLRGEADQFLDDVKK
jgi:hypothetical protein